jgi:hypothetical protein
VKGAFFLAATLDKIPGLPIIPPDMVAKKIFQDFLFMHGNNSNSFFL